jgi:hypothetical protein
MLLSDGAHMASTLAAPARLTRPVLVYSGA